MLWEISDVPYRPTSTRQWNADCEITNSKQQNGGDVEVEMYHWLRKAFTMISTEAVYGPENPFTHEPGMEDAFW